MLITLSGIDCAGKSSQALLLQKRLTDAGHNVTVFWFRPGYSREMDALRSLIRRIRPGSLPTTRESKKREQIFRNRRVKIVWITMAIIDTFLQYAIKLRLLNLIGRTIVCDRYLEDSIIDLDLKFPEQHIRRWRVVKLLRIASLKPDFSFLMMLPRVEILKRMEIKKEPFPDRKDIRDRRINEYENLSRKNKFLLVDADQELYDIEHLIGGHVFNFSKKQDC